MKKVEVFGSGCVKCNRLESNARKALEAAGIEAEVVHVSDMGEMAERGVMMTPALAVDGEVVVQGRVPGVEELQRLFE